jgi:hypothetical protein
MNTPEPKRRRFYPQPAWLVLLSLATTGFLFLSERYQWFPFNQHKGWTVLIAVAGVIAVLAILLLWWLAALVFRWRFQFCIRSLFVLTVAVALPCSWFAVKLQHAKRQREAVGEIETIGRGVAYYDWQVDADFNVLGSQPPGPKWLRSLLGDDFFQTVNLFRFDLMYFGGKATDAEVEHLVVLSQLRFLDLSRTQVTDAGVKHLRGLSELKLLNLEDTKVTDAGLGHLRDLSKLRELYLSGTPVTDAGLEHLKGLSQLQTLCLGGTQVTDAGTEHLKGLSRLAYLNLSDTQVTDAGLEHLTGLSRLKDLWLKGTHVSDAGTKRLQQALPNCEILR